VKKKKKLPKLALKDEENLRLCRQLIEFCREGHIFPDNAANHFDGAEAKWRCQTVAMLKAAFKYFSTDRIET